MPILLTSTNYIEPLNAGLAILQDKINRTIVMYDQNKQTVLLYRAGYIDNIGIYANNRTNGWNKYAVDGR